MIRAEFLRQTAETDSRAGMLRKSRNEWPLLDVVAKHAGTERASAVVEINVLTVALGTPDVGPAWFTKCAARRELNLRGSSSGHK
jgi:hypothetical protein